MNNISSSCGSKWCLTYKHMHRCTQFYYHWSSSCVLAVVSTCVCSFNLSSAAVLGSSSTQWGLCSAGATAGTLEHAQCTAQRQLGYVWIQILRLVVIKIFLFYETAHNNKSVSFLLSVKKTPSNCAEGSESGGHPQRIVNHNLSCILCLYSLDILAKYGHV